MKKTDLYCKIPYTWFRLKGNYGLNEGDILILATIKYASEKMGYAIMYNGYLAELYCMSERTVRWHIDRLVKAGLLDCGKLKNGSRKIVVKEEKLESMLKEKEDNK